MYIICLCVSSYECVHVKGFFRNSLKGNHLQVRKPIQYKPMVPNYGGYMIKHYCNKLLVRATRVLTTCTRACGPRLYFKHKPFQIKWWFTVVVMA